MKENYVQQALRTESAIFNVENGDDRLLHAGIGVATEGGEFLDALKKHLFYGKPLDRTNLKEEIGDLFWYLAIACDELGTTFEEVQATNIAKLTARYPDKFTEDKAENRDLGAERKILEGPKKLKVGDEVVVRTVEDLLAHYDTDVAGDIIVGDEVFVIEHMAAYCGIKCTIDGINPAPTAYTLEEDPNNWLFTAGMFSIL